MVASCLECKPSRVASAILVAAALAYPTLVGLAVFGTEEPTLLLGPTFPVLLVAFVPAAIFGIAFGLSCLGVRFHRFAVVALLVFVSLAAAVAWWVGQAALWSV